ncbi:hypothetical protein BDA99DRAFT_536202 [Phascolomyces articulosus]|uniref:Uncharacterized protein n=1 Tax=Phascolomyces articulosus TaxID=60185 RepID=A0AAD5K306_9FUNG|nr:hypothetical protein BDA99DRAFT_536202 [Phascolomyces articulosus]
MTTMYHGSGDTLDQLVLADHSVALLQRIFKISTSAMIIIFEVALFDRTDLSRVVISVRIILVVSITACIGMMIPKEYIAFSSTEAITCFKYIRNSHFDYIPYVVVLRKLSDHLAINRSCCIIKPKKIKCEIYEYYWFHSIDIELIQLIINDTYGNCSHTLDEAK